MKGIAIFITGSLLAVMVFSFSVSLVRAQPTARTTNYTLLAPIDHIQGAVGSGSFGTYIESMIKLVMALSVVLAVVMLVIGGFKYMTGEAIQMKGEGVKNMQQALIGLAIVFVSFLILQTINPNLLNLDLIVSKVEDARTGFAGPDDTAKVPSPSTATTPDIRDIDGRLAKTRDFEAALQQAARDAGVNPEELRAIVAIESGGNPNALSPAGAIGLTQMTVGAARAVDPSLRGVSDSEVANRLKDPTYNLSLGAKYYKQGLVATGGNLDRTAAYFNGGPSAIAPSRDCSGLDRWQCPYDEPGCYSTGRTGCRLNTGYCETRGCGGKPGYVKNVASARARATALATTP